MMFFARFFAVFFLVASFGFVTSVPSSNAVVQKRQDTADIMTTLTTLQNSIKMTSAEITSHGQAGTATEANITPLVNEYIAAIKTASSSLASLKTSSRNARRQSPGDLATTIVDILTAIVDALDTVLSALSFIPGVSILAAALHELLVELGTLLPGVLSLIASLLSSVAGLLQSLANLGLSSSVSSLGL